MDWIRKESNKAKVTNNLRDYIFFFVDISLKIREKV